MKKLLVLISLLVVVPASIATNYGNDAVESAAFSLELLNPYTGNVRLEAADLPGWSPLGQVDYQRYFNSRATQNEPLLGECGHWSHSYQWRLGYEGEDAQGRDVLVVLFPSGRFIRFTEVSSGVWQGPVSLGARLIQNGTEFTLEEVDSSRFHFESIAGIQEYRVTEYRNKDGFDHTLTYDGNGRLIEVTDEAGNALEFNYQTVTLSDSRTVTVIDSVEHENGLAVDYAYTEIFFGAGPWLALASVTYPGGDLAQYGYAVEGSAGQPVLIDSLDPRSEIYKLHIDYSTESGAPLGFASTVTEPDDSIGLASFNPVDGNGVTTTQALDGSLWIYQFAEGGLLLGKYNGSYSETFERDAGGTGFIIASIDGMGNRTDYLRSIYGNLLEATYPDDTLDSWDLDANDLPQSKTDALGHIHEFDRNAEGQITESTAPSGAVTEYQRNAQGQIDKIVYPDSAEITAIYDTSGYIFKHIDPLGGETIFQRDAYGRVTTITDPRNNVTTITYDGTSERVASITHPGNDVEEWEYDAAGNCILYTAPDGGESEATYDNLRRMKTFENPAGEVTTFHYLGGSSRVSRRIAPDGVETRYEYGDGGHLARIISAYGTAEEATEERFYDDAGRVLGHVAADGAGTFYTHNEMGRITAKTDPLGNVTHYEYDDIGRVTEETAPNGAVTEYHYDLDQPTSGSSEVDALLGVTRKYFDSMGRLTTMVDPEGHSYSFEYDLMGRKTRMVYPDSSDEEWTYDANGNVASYANRAGFTQSMTYDARDRLIWSQWNDGSPAEQHSYDAVGRLASVVTSGQSEVTYTYDLVGRLLSETQEVYASGAARTVAYTYDAAGRRATLTYPDSSVVEYGYTARGQVESIGAPGASPLVEYEYDDADRPIQKPYANQVVTESEYNLLGQLVYREENDGANILDSQEYQFDTVGNRTATIFADGSSESYGYDLNNQVSWANYFGVGGGLEYGIAWDYDKVGNRTDLYDSQGTWMQYTRNNLNQYTQIAQGGNYETPQWDANGNLSQYNGKTFTYDAQNRLVSVTGSGLSVQFTYDYRNRVNSRTLNGTTTYLVYDDWNLIAEYSSGGSLVAKYVHGARMDEVIVTVNSHGTFYHHHDLVGSVTHLTDTNGDIVESYSYDAFGAVTIADGQGQAIAQSAVDNRFFFTGREYIAEIGLYDYRNRVYSAELGRFVQTDPIRFEAGDVNIYRYCGNGPLTFVDSLGLWSWKALGASFVGGAIAGGVGGAITGSLAPGIGTVSGAAGGAAIGAITGVAGYVGAQLYEGFVDWSNGE